MHQLNVVKQFYESLYQRYNDTSYLKSDPIEIVYAIVGNKEFIALISSLFSYGKVENIKKFLISFFNFFSADPLNIEIKKSNVDLYYRFQKKKDIYLLVELLVYIYRNYGSLENLFISFSKVLEIAFVKFIDFAIEFGRCRSADRGYYNLFPSLGGMYSKRLNMFLRWMIRKDNIDFGLWSKYKTDELKYPMDTHITKFAISNHIITSKQNNIRNVNKITDYFKKISSEDPVKYDFALTRQAMLYGCLFMKSKHCRDCYINKKCLFY